MSSPILVTLVYTILCQNLWNCKTLTRSERICLVIIIWQYELVIPHTLLLSSINHSIGGSQTLLHEMKVKCFNYLAIMMIAYYYNYHCSYLPYTSPCLSIGTFWRMGLGSFYKTLFKLPSALIIFLSKYP